MIEREHEGEREGGRGREGERIGREQVIFLFTIGVVIFKNLGLSGILAIGAIETDY